MAEAKQLRPVSPDVFRLGGAGNQGISDNQRTSGLSPRRRLLTVDDYMALGAAGQLHGVRTELIHGEVMEMSPQGARHAMVLSKLVKALALMVGQNHHLRVQCPLEAIGKMHMPEPDLAIVEGSEDDYFDHHPSTAALVIEVSDSSLHYDLEVKSAIYASMGVAEYWIVDLENQRIEIQRQPIAAPVGASANWRYGATRVVDPALEAHISPLFQPDWKLDVVELLK